MSTTLNSVSSDKRISFYISIAFAIALVALMAFDTKVMSLDEVDSEIGFSPEQFAKDSFPDIQEYVETNAVDASALADEALQSASEAGEQYGVSSGIGHIIPVKFTGEVVEEASGIYTVDIADMPDDVVVRFQGGSAVNGTTLRDTTGEIKFSDFTNQIEYQDAGAALNEEMKRQVLEEVSEQDLTGETLEVVGSFNMINPKNWLITPVSIAISE